MAISPVQQTTVHATGVTSQAFPAITVAAGDTLIATISGNANTTSFAISDDQGNTWVKATEFVPAGQGYVGIWYALNCKAASTTVTFTSGASANFSCNLTEWPPLYGTDGANSQQTTAFTVSTPTLTTTQADDLIVALINAGGTNSPTAGPGNSFTALTLPSPATAPVYAGAYQAESATGSYSTNWTFSINTQAPTAIAAFKTSTPVGTTPPPPQIQSIYRAFTQPLWRPQGFTQGYNSSFPLGFPTPPPPPFAQILRNFSQQPLRIPGFGAGFNSSFPLAFPTTGPFNIRQILANWSQQPLRIPGFSAGFSSSFPQGYPTPPAPNIPAILANFSARVLPQGFTSAWDFSVPQGYPTPPAPNIRQIYQNFNPPFVQPQGFRSGVETFIAPTPSSPSVALPIAQIIKAWSPQPLVIPPTSGGLPPPLIIQVAPLLVVPPIRQILAAWQSPLVVPAYGSGGPAPFVPPPPPFPTPWIPLYLTEPDTAPQRDAVFIFQERIESITPSLMVLIYASASTIPRNSDVTITAKVTLPTGNGIPGLLPQLYIYEPDGTLALNQTMNPTGDPTLFEQRFFIQPTAPTGVWEVEVVSALGNLSLDSGKIPNSFTVA